MSRRQHIRDAFAIGRYFWGASMPLVVDAEISPLLFHTPPYCAVYIATAPRRCSCTQAGERSGSSRSHLSGRGTAGRFFEGAPPRPPLPNYVCRKMYFTLYSLYFYPSRGSRRKHTLGTISRDVSQNRADGWLSAGKGICSDTFRSPAIPSAAVKRHSSTAVAAVQSRRLHPAGAKLFPEGRARRSADFRGEGRPVLREWQGGRPVFRGGGHPVPPLSENVCMNMCFIFL